jgi:hypothetical protein
MSEHPLIVLLGIGIPTCLLLSGSIVLFSRDKATSSLLQLVGAGGLLIVVLTHIAEAFHLFPWMQWGLKQSAGHYLDLGCAVLGLVLFPGGYLLSALTRDPPICADCGIARGPASCDPGSSQIG